MTDRGLCIASVTALALGLALMIPFERAATLALGVACLFAFIVLGLFGLLTPELLSCDPNDAEAPGEARIDPSGSDVFTD